MNAEKLEVVHNVSLYAIVVLPILPIIGTASLPILAATVLFALIAISWFVFRSKLGQRIPERVWNLVVLSFVALSLLRVFLFDVDALDAVVQLLLVLTLIRLFGRQSVRDELQVFVLSLVTLAAATTLTDQLAFGLAFSAYVLVGTFALAVFHLRNEVQKRPKISFRGIATLNRPYASVLAAMSGAVLAASLVIFFAFPRVGLGFFAPKMRDSVQMTGFSESVELGNHGVVRDNPAVVLRVEFDRRPPETRRMHWRMMAFDRYDGRSWSRTLDERRSSLASSSRDERQAITDSAGRRALQVQRHVKGSGSLNHMQIYMEPLGTSHLPTLWPTKFVRLGSESVSVPFGPRSGWVQEDAYGDLHHTVADQVGMIFQVWAWDTGGEMSAGRKREPYLQLPQFQPRFAQLASRIAPSAAAPEAIAQGVANYLRSNYTYTTDLPEVGDSPVESFLFDAKRGHCEYFATSATLLLRQRGVPARIVNGFLGGAWNSVGGYLAVRQGDAHTWVEYVDSSGQWRMLDPTPSSAIAPPNAVVATAREYFDALKLFWSKWIIEYDLSAQLEVVRRVSSSFKPRSSHDTVERIEAPKESGWGPLTAALMSFLVAWFFGRWFVRQRRVGGLWYAAATLTLAGLDFAALHAVFDLTWAVAATGAALAGFASAWATRRKLSTAEQAWLVVEHAAAQAGYQRPQDEGPETMLKRMSHALGGSRAIDEFLTAYLRVRFAGTGDDDLLLPRAAAAAADIRRLRRSDG